MDFWENGSVFGCGDEGGGETASFARACWR